MCLCPSPGGWVIRGGELSGGKVLSGARCSHLADRVKYPLHTHTQSLGGWLCEMQLILHFVCHKLLFRQWGSNGRGAVEIAYFDC